MKNQEAIMIKGFLYASHTSEINSSKQDKGSTNLIIYLSKLSSQKLCTNIISFNISPLTLILLTCLKSTNLLDVDTCLFI